MGTEITGSELINWGIAAAVLIGGLLIVCTLGAGFAEPRSTSQYTGQAVDLENERGFVLQTTQVHLKTDDRSSTSETFCVLDEHRDEQMSVLREAVREGHRLTITYERPLYVPLWECESNTSIIQDIEVRQGGDA